MRFIRNRCVVLCLVFVSAAFVAMVARPKAVRAAASTFETTAQAAPGDLDPTFSGDGKETTNIGGSDSGRAVAIQQDGYVVVVGGTYVGGGGSFNFALARYSPDGSLDANFSDDGTHTTDFGGFDYATAVAIQADGKIVVAGYSNVDGTFDFALTRYTAGGILDTSFSEDGKLTTDFGGQEDAAYGVAIQPDGRILVAGHAGVDFGLARYDANGSLDTSFPRDKFPGDGKQATDFGGIDYGLAIVIQADARIVVAGYTDTPAPCEWCEDPPPDFALARYDADGTLDPSFSGDGMQTTDFGGDDYAVGVALQTDGKIVAVGSSYSFVGSSTAFALARYNPDGSPDPTFGWLGAFGWPGQVITQFSGADGASAVAIQSDGKIVAVGSASEEAALTRYNRDGSLDATFSGDGMQTTQPGGWAGVALQPDGRIVAVGGASGATDADFALARYYGGSVVTDTTAPDTTITGGPMGTTNDSRPTLSFDSNETGSTFECRVDVGTLSVCNSPYRTFTLSDGEHTFEVRAIDAAGNADTSPAGRSFSVDTTAPETTITDGPAGTTYDRTTMFRFESSEAGATFACRVDTTSFSACSSPYTTPLLSVGSYNFQVRATDGAGNTASTPASRSWVIVVDYRSEVLATYGLVSYWRLGETSGRAAADANGANDGTYRNGVRLDRPSALLDDSNASASFDGPNDYVSVPDSRSLDITDSFTLEVWVKRSGTSSSIKTMLSKGNGSYLLSFVNNVLTLTKANSGTIAKASVSTIDTTGFHHIVATKSGAKSGATVKLYIDGVDRTGMVTNRVVSVNSTALNIGRNTAGSEYFAGLIDEVAIYNVALNATQVHQHFKASGR